MSGNVVISLHKEWKLKYASQIEQFLNVPISAFLSSHPNIIISQFQFNLNENEKKYANFIYTEISSHFVWNFIFHFLHFAYFLQQFIISNLKLNEFFHNTSIEPSLHSFSFHMEIFSISDIIEFFLLPFSSSSELSSSNGMSLAYSHLTSAERKRSDTKVSNLLSWATSYLINLFISITYTLNRMADRIWAKGDKDEMNTKLLGVLGYHFNQLYCCIASELMYLCVGKCEY